MSPRMKPSARFVSIGECMVEIRLLEGDRATIGFGGDTLNVAAYLARLGASVDYATALGDDPYSDAMMAGWAEEGIGTGLVRRLAGRVPGLYTIRTDKKGERSFHYWRDSSPARELFDLPDAENLAVALAGYGLIYLSGISLSLYGRAGRERLFGALDRAREGGSLVAFDSNYRPRGWDSADEARAVFAEMARRTDIALPTLDDEAALHGDADAASCARRLREAGIAEVVVKHGPGGCWIDGPDGAFEAPVPVKVDPVDTTAAGDSFNAGYLSGRALGADQRASALRGHWIAAAVIAHRGAIIPRSAMPDPSHFALVRDQEA
ncbi:sugar kinase [Inquilinus sp. CAU 1745]